MRFFIFFIFFVAVLGCHKIKDKPANAYSLKVYEKSYAEHIKSDDAYPRKVPFTLDDSVVFICNLPELNNLYYNNYSKLFFYKNKSNKDLEFKVGAFGNVSNHVSDDYFDVTDISVDSVKYNNAMFVFVCLFDSGINTERLYVLDARKMIIFNNIASFGEKVFLTDFDKDKNVEVWIRHSRIPCETCCSFSHYEGGLIDTTVYDYDVNIYELEDDLMDSVVFDKRICFKSNRNGQESYFIFNDK